MFIVGANLSFIKITRWGEYIVLHQEFSCSERILGRSRPRPKRHSTNVIYAPLWPNSFFFSRKYAHSNSYASSARLHWLNNYRPGLWLRVSCITGIERVSISINRIQLIWLKYPKFPRLTSISCVTRKWTLRILYCLVPVLYAGYRQEFMVLIRLFPFRKWHAKGIATKRWPQNTYYCYLLLISTHLADL